MWDIRCGKYYGYAHLCILDSFICLFSLFLTGHATSASCFFPSKERIEIINLEDLVGILKSFVWLRVWKFFFYFTDSFWFWTCSINLYLLLPQNYSLVTFALGCKSIWRVWVLLYVEIHIVVQFLISGWISYHCTSDLSNVSNSSRIIVKMVEF